MASIWSETARLPQFPPLQENIHTDVLIIGGGMAGLLCAYRLHTAGVDYILCEANTISTGITKNTTAKITSQHGLIYHKLGTEKAKLYLEANQKALNEYRRLCADIDCDYSEQNSYVYSINDLKKLQKELSALKKLNFPASYQKPLSLPISTVGAVKFPGQAQFHPLKFLAAIAKTCAFTSIPPSGSWLPTPPKPTMPPLQQKRSSLPPTSPFSISTAVILSKCTSTVLTVWHWKTPVT